MKNEIFVLFALLSKESSIEEINFNENDLGDLFYNEVKWSDLNDIVIKLSSLDLIKYTRGGEDGFAEQFLITFDRKKVEKYFIESH